jgi:DNA-directed RNA polymerase beta subunit
MNTQELCSKYEEPNESGGYFIVKGYERILRLLTMTRRNYVSRGFEEDHGNCFGFLANGNVSWTMASTWSRIYRSWSSNSLFIR